MQCEGLCILASSLLLAILCGKKIQEVLFFLAIFIFPVSFISAALKTWANRYLRYLKV